MPPRRTLNWSPVDLDTGTERNLRQMETQCAVDSIDCFTNSLADILPVRDVPPARGPVYVMARSVRRLTGRSDALRDDGGCDHDCDPDDRRNHVANVTDRRASLAILKAVGWTNRSVRQLIVLEGILIGFVAGIVGLSISYITIYVLYDLVPWDEPLLIGVSLLLPVLFGTIASLLPAQIAARVNPYQELKDAG